MLAVIAHEHQPGGPVDGKTEQRLGQDAADVRGGVLQGGVIPDSARVAQQALVEDREVGRGHDRPATGHAGRHLVGVRELRHHPRLDRVAEHDALGDVVLIVSGMPSTRGRPNGAHTRSAMTSRKSRPSMRWIRSINT